MCSFSSLLFTQTWGCSIQGQILCKHGVTCQLWLYLLESGTKEMVILTSYNNFCYKTSEVGLCSDYANFCHCGSTWWLTPAPQWLCSLQSSKKQTSDVDGSFIRSMAYLSCSNRVGRAVYLSGSIYKSSSKSSTIAVKLDCSVVLDMYDWKLQAFKPVDAYKHQDIINHPHSSCCSKACLEPSMEPSCSG